MQELWALPIIFITGTKWKGGGTWEKNIGQENRLATPTGPYNFLPQPLHLVRLEHYQTCSFWNMRCQLTALCWSHLQSSQHLGMWLVPARTFELIYYMLIISRSLLCARVLPLLLLRLLTPMRYKPGSQTPWTPESLKGLMFWFSRAQWNLRMCMWDKFPGDTDSTVWGPHCEKRW